MMRKLLTCHYGAKTKASCWMSPKHHQRTYTPLGLMVLVRRGWAASGTWESPSQRIWLNRWGRRSSASTTSGSWGSSEFPENPWDLLRWCGVEHPDRKHHCLSSQDRRALQRVVRSAELLALHFPTCRTCTTGGVEPEPAGSWRILTTPITTCSNFCSQASVSAVTLLEQKDKNVLSAGHQDCELWPH